MFTVVWGFEADRSGVYTADRCNARQRIDAIREAMKRGADWIEIYAA